MVDTKSKWEDELGRWLKPFLDRLGHKAPRHLRRAAIRKPSQKLPVKLSARHGCVPSPSGRS
jgi:hypothetical protein